eukprot:5852223-Amphidinium_carterae.2
MTRRFPNELLKGNRLDNDALAMSSKGSSDFERTQEYRKNALCSSLGTSICSSESQTRQSVPLVIGDRVFLVRKNLFGKVWRESPAVIIGLQGTSLWLNMHGSLLKVVSNMCRKAEGRDLWGIEEVEMPGLKEDILARRHRGRYRDLTGTPSMRIPGTPSGRRRPSSQLSTGALESEPMPQRRRVESSAGNNVAEQSDPNHGPNAKRVPESGDEVMPSAESQSAPVETAVLVPSVAAASGGLPSSAIPIPADTPVIDADADLLERHETFVSTWCGVEHEETKAQQSKPLATSGTPPQTVWSSGEVRWQDIPTQDRALLHAIRKKVHSMLFRSKAMSVLSVEESEKIWPEHPNRIISSRLHLRYKPVEGSSGFRMRHVAKCRWILIGYQDPDALALETRSPAVGMATIYLAISVALGLGMKVST